MKRSDSQKFTSVLLAAFLLLVLSVCQVSASDVQSVTVEYRAARGFRSSLTFDYCDDWFLEPDNEYNHKIMQASLGGALAAYRDVDRDYEQADDNIIDFFQNTGFESIQSDDYHCAPSADTIATAIASKKIEDQTLIVVAISGAGYKDEWMSNFSIANKFRTGGFNDAARKVEMRLFDYITNSDITGDIRLWTFGFSRSAAVANIVAADATLSKAFKAVYGYSVATPRTTRSVQAKDGDNIFNAIGAFDPVPKLPFPEWGYKRYGVDLFTPAQETDSLFAEKKLNADRVSQSTVGVPYYNNPQINRQLHTLIDYVLFFISSAESYEQTFQGGILDIWKKLGPETLFSNISDKLNSVDEITMYQLKEFWNLLDFLAQTTYTTLWGLKSDRVGFTKSLWQRDYPIAANLIHEHYDEVYISWLFSSDDPAEIYSDNIEYRHFSVIGDLDIEVYDQNMDFVLRIDRDGTVSTDPADAGFNEQKPQRSETEIFGERPNPETFLVLPADQVFYVMAYPHKTEDIRYSIAKFDAEHIRGSIDNVFYQTMDAGYWYIEEVDPERESEYTDEDLLQEGFTMVEPWSNEVVYSPSALMRLENTDVFHPSPVVFLTLGGLFVLLFLFLLILFLVWLIKSLIRLFRKLKK